MNQLTSSPEDTLANPSPRTGDAKEPKTTDTSGPTSGRQFATYDPSTQSWKTFAGTEASDSTEYSETWPKTGYMHNGRAYELPTPEHRTIEKGSSSWLPTPTATDWKRDNFPSCQKRKSPPLPAVDTHFPGGRIPKRYWQVVAEWGAKTREEPPTTTKTRTGRDVIDVRFIEWTMGLPDGWVTSPEIGLKRADQMKALGNGVCPQQAALALERLFGGEVPA